ncbi:hypothetical protein EV368DRAFT_90322 [Lentinula lateritia]|nr:hypothetical protein EV368DRAFT_90322 [Lentinula lateritia]
MHPLPAQQPSSRKSKLKRIQNERKSVKQLTQGTTNYSPVSEITIKPKWYKQHGVKATVPQTESTWGKYKEKIRLLRSAIEKYADANASQYMGKPVEGRLSNEEEIPDVTVEELDGFDSEGYDTCYLLS